MKKLTYFSLSLMVLLFSGCGGGSDDASCRFEVQQNLDTGNYAAVIAELSNENSECRSAYLNNEFQVDLGAAYMGEAGLSLSDIIALIGVDNGTFGTFVDSVSKKQSTSALTSLGNAGAAFTIALNGTDCNGISLLSSSEKDICLYIGLTETMRATTTISYLLDDIAALFNGLDLTSQDAAKEEMKASMCALQFANIGTTCADATTISATDVNFTYSDDSNRSFREITVTMVAAPNNVYHRLATATGVTPGTTVVTEGYCSNDFLNPSSTWSTGLYACPQNKDPLQEDLNISTLLVNTLNSGLDAVSGALSGDPVLQQDIIDYKNDINTDANDTISIDEIQAYLKTL